MAFDPELGDWVRKDRNHYARVRADGYEALVGDRHSEIAGISAPVFRKDGELAAALTLTMPVHRYDERYVKHVLAAARELGRNCLEYVLKKVAALVIKARSAMYSIAIVVRKTAQSRARCARA